MAKVRKNFKLSSEGCLSLVRLSGLWACDQTAVIERLLREADPSEMDREERESTQEALQPVSDDVVTPSDARAYASAPRLRGLVSDEEVRSLQKMQGSITRPQKLVYPSYKKRGGEVRPIPKKGK